MFVLLKRIIKSGWTSFSRDPGLMLGTIFIMLIPIASITFFFILKDTGQSLISSLEEKADISVYFKPDVQETDIFNIKKQLLKITEVKALEYISKEQALDEFIQRHKDDPVLMESLEELEITPFLALLNIKAFEASQYELISGFLEKQEFEDIIEKVDYYQRKPVIERIFLLTSFTNKVGIGLSIVLAIVAILVVFNTIRLAIIHRQEEIKVQRLVGASNWFIRGPFLVQGAISGIFAFIFCFLIFAALCWFLSPKLAILFSDLNIWNYFSSNFLFIILIQLATGVGLGIISSAIAIRKHLKI